MVDSILSRSCAFSTVSARSRSSVSGVRRSCEMAASRRVRFSIRPRKRVCMSLKARAACLGLDGAGLRQRWRIDIVPEPLGGRCQRAKRGGDTAHRPHRHGENDDRHDAHGEEELTRRRQGRLPAARSQTRATGRPPEGWRPADPRKPANPPKPCIIGPCPIMCQGPNGGPPLDAMPTRAAAARCQARADRQGSP